MIDFFYGVGLIISILNLLVLTNSKRSFEITEWIYKFKKITGVNPTKKDFRNNNDFEILTLWSFTVVITVIWMIFGLLTHEWIIFLLLFIFNIILNHIKKYLSSFESLKYIVTCIKATFGTIIITILVINHFHLHIDLVKYFISLFKH